MHKEFAEKIALSVAESKDNLQNLKIKLCKQYNLSTVPSNAEILSALQNQNVTAETLKKLCRKPTRTISGVAVVAVMTSPAQCPHGRCMYCPGGPSENSPQSYTGKEPAGLRGYMYGYDPYLQTAARIKQLNAIGHSTDKIDLIVMGGTFLARPPQYQDWFVKRCFDALNCREAATLQEAQLLNETSANRCIGLTVETRPDYCMETEINQLLKLGATRVEIGVQTIYDNILAKVGRGHTVDATILATKLAKNAGLKVCYHMMPGLPFSNPDLDLKAFKTIFENADFKPDMLKIYPTLVLKGTALYELWKNNGYKPYDLQTIVELLAEVKKNIPSYVRIQRIQRDIPAHLIVSGVKKGDLRNLVLAELLAKGWKCNCIRCREVGFWGRAVGQTIKPDTIKLKHLSYDASGGLEYFISFEAPPNVLIGFARLRIFKIDNVFNAIVRDLKVFGRAVRLAVEPSDDEWQHRGYGAKLLRECEQIAKQYTDKIFVLSGVGSRNYYRRFGYVKEGYYMTKQL